MSNGCVKHAEILGKSRSYPVGDHPQSWAYRIATHMQYVYNHSFTPTFALLFTHDYPQQKTRYLHLLRRLFSPLSTPPITITTT